MPSCPPRLGMALEPALRWPTPVVGRRQARRNQPARARRGGARASLRELDTRREGARCPQCPCRARPHFLIATRPSRANCSVARAAPGSSAGPWAPAGQLGQGSPSTAHVSWPTASARHLPTPRLRRRSLQTPRLHTTSLRGMDRSATQPVAGRFDLLRSVFRPGGGKSSGASGISLPHGSADVSVSSSSRTSTSTRREPSPGRHLRRRRRT